MPRCAIHPKLRKALDETGLPWTIELGSRHHHLRLAGRLVCVLPLGGTTDRDPHATRNTIAQVRRAARAMKAENPDRKGT